MSTESDTALLAAIDAAIAGNPEGILRYKTIAGREVERMSLTELLKAREQVAARVAAGSGGVMRVARFRRAR